MQCVGFSFSDFSHVSGRTLLARLRAGGCDDNRADIVDDRNDDDRESAEGNNRNDVGIARSGRVKRRRKIGTPTKKMPVHLAEVPIIYIDNAYGKSIIILKMLFMLGTYVSLQYAYVQYLRV